MSSCGKICGAPWAPSFFASSDYIDPNLMENSVLATERKRGEGGSDSDIMATLMTQVRRVGGSQGSCGCGGYFRPRGRLNWLPGKPPSLTQTGRVTEREKLPSNDRWGDKRLVEFH